MAAFTVTADDSSPLISYSAGGWTDSFDETLQTQYEGFSAHSTSTPGATASFTFHGTGVSVFGARRSNFGAFSVTVDGRTVNGTSNGQDNTIQQMAAFTDLPLGEHTLTLTNLGSALDLDKFVVRSQVGRSGSVVAQSMDDGDPMFRYLPNDQAWQTSTIARNFNNTIHFTGVAGAGLQFNFTGEALALFGTTSIEHAPFNVTIDNGTPVTISPSSPLIHSRTLTFLAGGLSPGQHSVSISREVPPNGGPGFISLDVATAFVAADGVPGGSNNGNAQRPSTTNIPAVVGIVLGVFALIVGGLAIGFFVRRRRMMSRGFSSSGYNEKGSADHSWARRFFFRRGQSQDLEKSHPSWQLPLQRPPISLPRPQEPPATFVPVQIQRNAYNNPANMITVSSPYSEKNPALGRFSNFSLARSASTYSTRTYQPGRI